MTDVPVPFLRYDTVVVRKDGTLEPWFVNALNTLIGRSGGEYFNATFGLINGAQQAANNAAAAIAAANAAAAAAIAASGSTEVDSESDTVDVTSGTYASKLTCNLDHAGGGNYNITTVANVDTVVQQFAVSDIGTFNGEWQIIENPGAFVLANGTFTVTTTDVSSEVLGTLYLNEISFSAGWPSSATSYADNNAGAVTIELQLRRASGGTNTVTDMLYLSMLVTWS